MRYSCKPGSQRTEPGHGEGRRRRRIVCEMCMGDDDDAMRQMDMMNKSRDCKKRRERQGMSPCWYQRIMEHGYWNGRNNAMQTMQDEEMQM